MDKVSKKEALTRKARKKYLSQNLASLLIGDNPESPLIKSYRNSFYCSETLSDMDGEGLRSSHYCKNRWCPLCQSIRTATLINHYHGQLSALPDPYMVTLTAPTVTAQGLKRQINRFRETWRKVLHDDCRKAGYRMRGIRKTECTSRPNGHYHYHYHVLVSGRSESLRMVDSWLRRMMPDRDKYTLQLFDNGNSPEHPRYTPNRWTWSEASSVVR